MQIDEKKWDKFIKMIYKSQKKEQRTTNYRPLLSYFD